MPLPPAPLPRLSLRAPPPAPTINNPVTFGSVRAAALAARQARQLRLKKQAQLDEQSCNPNLLRAGACVSASIDGAIRSRSVPLHEKKNLKLQLNMQCVTKPEVPALFASTSAENLTTISEEIPWQAMKDDEENGAASEKMKYGRPRRQSSVTLSLNSPEGAEFQEVAHDGPEQLGKLTKRIKKLGKGAGGVVFLSLYLPALKLVAVKEVAVYKEQERAMVKHELHALHENLVPLDKTTSSVPVGVLSGWRHRLSSLTKPSTAPTNCPYLVAFYGAYLLPAKCAISIVMEFMDRGSLQDLLDAKVAIPEPVLRHCAFCCVTALEHMHRHRMIHRDIKPANILMNRNGEFKIADFGLAGTLLKSESFFSEFEGTMMYMAPERIQGQTYSYVSDVWSLGVSLFYLATGSYPFTVEEGFFGLEEAIVNDPLPPMPNRFSSECRDFIKGLLQRDPTKRLTADRALFHPFLRGYGTSDAFARFPLLWEKMLLTPGPVAREDVATIAQLIADFVQRQQRRVSRRASGRYGASTKDMPQQSSSSVLSHLTQYFTDARDVNHDQSETSRRQALELLASDCVVSGNELKHLLDRAITRQVMK